MRGVLEDHTTPESLEMLSNVLTKQSGSALHDTQVHVYDCVGHPTYTKNRNAHILKNCDMGGAIQRLVINQYFPLFICYFVISVCIALSHNIPVHFPTKQNSSLEPSCRRSRIRAHQKRL